jgi:putative membrane protein
VLRQRRNTARVIAAADGWSSAPGRGADLALVPPGGGARLCAHGSAHHPREPRAAAARRRRVALSVGRSLLLPSIGYTAAIWAWHIPAGTRRHSCLARCIVAMIATLLGVSLWFWGAVLRARLEALPTLLLMLMQTGMLGALLTFAKAPLYPLVAAGAAALGRAPLADQQLAGLLMWVPMALIFLAAALWQTARALAPSAAQAARLRA